MNNASISRLLVGVFCATLSTTAVFAVEPAARTLALAEARDGHNAAALPILLQLAETTPVDAEACAALANIRLGEKKVEEAIALIKKAAEAAPDRAEYHSRLGQMLGVRIGQVSFFQQAAISGQMIEAFEKSIEIDPNHVPGYVGLCRYYSNAPAIGGGSMEKATEYAAEVEKRDPVSGAIEYGLLAERRSDWAEALKRYDVAAKFVPNGAWFHERRGAMLVKLDRKDEARAAFKRSLEIDPYFAPAKEGLGKLAPQS